MPKAYKVQASNPYGNTPEPQYLQGFHGYKDFLFDCILIPVTVAGILFALEILYLGLENIYFLIRLRQIIFGG